jgi:hypothetical protein
VNPNVRLSCSLVAALVLWWPTATACLDGDVDLAAAALRFGVALAGAWLGIGLLGRLVRAYTAEAEAAAGTGAEGDAPGPGTPRRRRDDRGAPHDPLGVAR